MFFITKAHLRVDPTNLALRLLYVRQQLGLKQAELAKLCGVSKGTIGNIESCENSKGSVKLLRLLSQELNIDPGFFLGFHEESDREPHGRD